MVYQHNKRAGGAIAKRLASAKSFAVVAVSVSGLALSLVPGVYARGSNNTTTTPVSVVSTKASSIVSCSDSSLTISVNTVANDKVNQILVQADGVNVRQQAVARRVISNITIDAPAASRWSVWRQEKDGWIPDLNTQIQSDGSCGPNTWL
ncbi:MAG: hypothetical protein WCJ60_01445 [bacterium]